MIPKPYFQIKASFFADFRKFALLILLFFIFACSADEEMIVEHSQNPLKEVSSSTAVYKGIFASQNSQYRGTIALNFPGGKKDLNTFNPNAVASLTLQTGEVYIAKAVELVQKSSDFKLAFDSEDLSFNFTVDETDTPRITDVVFKKETSSILAAEETADSPVTPVTGTYKCTNCQDQNATVNGIELNNLERTFNMLLTTKDGSTSLSIQAVVGMLVDTQLLVNESCTSNDQFTFCMIKSGDHLTTEPLTWSGVHRFTAEGSDSTPCSSISGVFDYSSKDFGSIKGEFSSDKTCPNTTYFISDNGDDSNTGLSPEDPWKTIDKVNSLNLQSGDIVLFEGSYDYPGNLYFDANDGNNSANAVKISSYGTGRATIKAGNGYGIFAYNTSGFVIDNIIVAGSGMDSNTDSGIYFLNDLPGNIKLDLIEITNCEVYGFKDNGIVIGGWNENSGFTNVLIENNKVHDILDKGIFSFGKFSSTKTGYAHSNITVRSCEVYNIKGYKKEKSAHSGNGIVLSDVQHSVIEHCTAYNSGSGNTHTGGGPVGIWYWDADQVIIQFNEVYGMASGSNKDGGGFDLDGGVTNGVMQYNYSHDNEGAGYLIGQFGGARPMANITVRYNISQNDASTNGGSIFLFNGENTTDMKDIFVYNNTLYTSKQASNSAIAAIKLLQWKTMNDNLNFHNNILYVEDGVNLIDVPSGYAGTFTGNLYHSNGTSFNILYQGTNYSSLAVFREKTQQEISNNLPVGYQGDPLVTDAGKGGTIGFGNKLSDLLAYKLQLDSPANSNGIILPYNAGNRDFYGNQLPQPGTNQIGAHKY